MRVKFETDGLGTSTLADFHEILEPSADLRRLLEAVSLLSADRGADDVVRAVIPLLH